MNMFKKIEFHWYVTVKWGSESYEYCCVIGCLVAMNFIKTERDGHELWRWGWGCGSRCVDTSNQEGLGRVGVEGLGKVGADGLGRVGAEGLGRTGVEGFQPTSHCHTHTLMYLHTSWMVPMVTRL